MNEYIEAFFEQFDYDLHDRCLLLQAYTTICSQDETADSWQRILADYSREYTIDYEAQIDACKAVAQKVKIHPYTIWLLLFICMSESAKKHYADNGYSEKIFHDTMLDLKYKLDECKELYGICGIFVPRWMIGFFNLTRFALGRLQFELVPFEHTYQKNGKSLMPDSLVIKMHIPRTGTSLDPKSCDDAFERAKEFFAEKLKNQPLAFVCSSWLLYPQNENILPEKSNTRQFFKRFDIIESRENEGDHPDLWRLFDREYTGDPDKLPYDTSLRRAFVDHLKAGGNTGNGYGVFFY